MKIDIRDENIREALAAFIIVRRLGFDPQTEIGLMVADDGSVAVAVKRGSKTFAMMMGKTLLTAQHAHAQWDEWAKNIHLGQVDDSAIEDLLATSKVYQHATEHIVQMLREKQLLSDTDIRRFAEKATTKNV